MKVSEIAKDTTVSIELFPPKNPDNVSKSLDLVDKMVSLNPSFVNITYGAGGGTKDTTMELVKRAQKSSNAVSHLNSDRLNRDGLKLYLEQLRDIEVDNLLALRGDISIDSEFKDSLEFTRAVRELSDICIGGACYPEGHKCSKGIDNDIEFFKRKVDAGCDYMVTQLGFNTDLIVGYIQRLKQSGIEIPILVGIMPIISVQSLIKIRDSIGVEVPKTLISIADKYQDDSEAMKQAGIEFCINEIKTLQNEGLRNIHIYTMNNYDVTKEIIQSIT